MIYLKIFWKNQIFPIFFSKPMLTTCLCSHISQNCAIKFQNWVYLCLGGVLKLKVSKGELIISNGLEMADDYLPGGWEQPPLPLLGLSRARAYRCQLGPSGQFFWPLTLTSSIFTTSWPIRLYRTSFEWSNSFLFRSRSPGMTFNVSYVSSKYPYCIPYKVKWMYFLPRMYN